MMHRDKCRAYQNRGVTYRVTSRHATSARLQVRSPCVRRDRRAQDTNGVPPARRTRRRARHPKSRSASGPRMDVAQYENTPKQLGMHVPARLVRVAGPRASLCDRAASCVSPARAQSVERGTRAAKKALRDDNRMRVLTGCRVHTSWGVASIHELELRNAYDMLARLTSANDPPSLCSKTLAIVRTATEPFLVRRAARC
jgi:hypothetical protein